MTEDKTFIETLENARTAIWLSALLVVGVIIVYALSLQPAPLLVLSLVFSIFLFGTSLFMAKGFTVIGKKYNVPRLGFVFLLSAIFSLVVEIVFAFVAFTIGDSTVSGAVIEGISVLPAAIATITFGVFVASLDPALDSALSKKLSRASIVLGILWALSSFLSVFQVGENPTSLISSLYGILQVVVIVYAILILTYEYELFSRALFYAKEKERGPLGSEEVKTEYPQVVPVWKFVLLSLVTFGVYQAVWMYRGWKFLRLQYPENPHLKKISPFLRAVFGGLFFGSLASHMKKSLKEKELLCDYSPLVLGLSYFFLSVLWRLPGPLAFIGFLNIVPILPVLIGMNTYLRKEVPELPEKKFTWWQIVLVLFGAAFLSFAVLASIHPVD
jgi:hypothetical protein